MGKQPQLEADEIEDSDDHDDKEDNSCFDDENGDTNSDDEDAGLEVNAIVAEALLLKKARHQRERHKSVDRS